MNASVYRCPHCGKTVARYHEGQPKQWLKSYCQQAGKDVRLQLVVKDKPGGKQQ